MVGLRLPAKPLTRRMGILKGSSKANEVTVACSICIIAYIYVVLPNLWWVIGVLLCSAVMLWLLSPFIFVFV